MHMSTAYLHPETDRKAPPINRNGVQRWIWRGHVKYLSPADDVLDQQRTGVD